MTGDSTDEASDLPPLPLASWRRAVADVPERGLALDQIADEAERAALAAALEVPSIERLAFRGRLRLAGGERLSLDGTLSLQLTQTCVVSLEPLAQVVEAPVHVVFAPQPERAAANARRSEPEDDLDPFAEVDDEPIENGYVDIGRVLFEELASRIDPFPRKPDATLDWKDTTPQPGSTHPFAKLSALRDRQEKS